MESLTRNLNSIELSEDKPLVSSSGFFLSKNLKMVSITVDFFKELAIMCKSFEDGDIIGFSDNIDGVEFGEFNLILSQVEFDGENWLTYARLNLFGKKLIFDRLFVVKEHRIVIKFKRRKGRFVKLPKDYFEKHGYIKEE